MDDEQSIHFNKRTDKTYVSRAIQTAGGKIRIASKVMDGEESHHFATLGEELVIRVSPKDRQEIIAKFYQDDRGIFRLTFQKWRKGTPFGSTYFTFLGPEINRILEFLLNIKKLHLPNDDKVNITDDELRQRLLSSDQARELVVQNEELVLSIARNEITSADIVALGYRRRQLERFEHLLSDEPFFESEVARLSSTPEGVWQSFFEANKWIFGYGLSYIFLSSLDGRKLEQTVQGYSVASLGKRADALLKTQALISSLCFVEIKRHTTRLLNSTQYRSGVWQPSADLSGGLAQSQATVQSALESLTSRVHIEDDEGAPTGEALFNIEPRSFLIVGSLAEFQADHGANESKFRSFELFRRNVRRPEIITFDELFHRAKFIVEHNSSDAT